MNNDMAVWISVEEGLPNKDGDYEVLVADLDCEQDKFVATSHFSNKVNINTGNIFGFGFRPAHYNIDFTKHKVISWRNKTY